MRGTSCSFGVSGGRLLALPPSTGGGSISIIMDGRRGEDSEARDSEERFAENWRIYLSTQKVRRKKYGGGLIFAPKWKITSGSPPSTPKAEEVAGFRWCKRF